MQEDIEVITGIAWNTSVIPEFAPHASTSKRQLDSNSPSSNESHEPPKKQKRKQFTACDPCRLRRVRCERDSDSEDGPCKGCKKRNFVCSKDYNTAKAAEARTGRLLNQAAALYGTNGAPHSNGNVSHAPDELLPLVPAPVQEEAPLFAYDSAEGRIGLIQSNTFVVNELVHCYKAILLAQNPLMGDFDGFIQRFEQSGRRLMSLNTDDKAIGALIIALAGRVTDLPLLAGSASPGLKALGDGSVDTESIDMSSFGHNREATCRALEQRARSFVEQTFFRREASVDSINALMAMQEIDDIDDPETAMPFPRIYSAAAIEQLRAIAQKPSKTQNELWAMHGPLMKSVILMDAMWGFTSGRPFQISDDDLVLLYPRIHLKSPAEAVKLPANATPKDYVLNMLDQMIIMAREMRKHLMSPLAKMRGVGPSAKWLKQQVNDLQSFLACVQEGLAKRPMDRSSSQALKAVQLGLTMQLAWMHWQNQQWLEKTMDQDKRAELQLSLQEMSPALYKAVCDLADSCRGLLEDGMLIGRNLLWSALAEAADILFKLPVGADGGLPSFTLERKVECAEHYIRCVRLLAYSWPTSARALPDLEHKLSVLRSRLYLETGKRSMSPVITQKPPSRASIHELGDGSDLDWLLGGQQPAVDIDFSALFAGPPAAESQAFSSASSASSPSDVDILLRSLAS